LSIPAKSYNIQAQSLRFVERRNVRQPYLSYLCSKKCPHPEIKAEAIARAVLAAYQERYCKIRVTNWGLFVQKVVEEKAFPSSILELNNRLFIKTYNPCFYV
jgi:hypothetical protein